MISFNKSWNYAYPDTFPTSYFWTRKGLAVAPFWSDNDIRKEGSVRYATYCTVNQECSKSHEGDNLLKEVNEYVQQFVKEGEPPFRGRWLLVAHWDHVPPSPHGEIDHMGIPEDELNKVYMYNNICSDVSVT